MGVVVRYTPPRVDPALVIAGVKEVAEHAGAEVLLAAAKQLVPEDTGALKESGIVVPSVEGAAVVFSATNEDDGYDYAARQHEDETLNHPNGGQAHYLADPMQTEARAILLAMIAEVKL